MCEILYGIGNTVPFKRIEDTPDVQSKQNLTLSIS